jgi:N-[(2S)-2-amino-2-carboxyethyl]-L-glutamate dehydrogenase
MTDRMLRYLSRADVERAARSVDAVQTIRGALVLHAEGRTTLPAEAYLGWRTPDGSAARSLALPGMLHGDRAVAGLKIINSSLGNVGRGIQRAEGLTVLFDTQTAHPVAILEAATLSALRTAAYTVLAYTVLSVRGLAAPARRIAIIGCGALGQAHMELLHRADPDAEFVLYDQAADRLAAAAEAFPAGKAACQTVTSAEAAVRGSSVVVTTTTATEGYIPYEWLSPGALIAHVSLDDVLPDVVARADLVLVDDWDLVRDDSRRLLGRLYKAGKLADPGHLPAGPVGTGPRAVDGTLAEVLAGRHPGRTRPEEIILSNPFGMGILDVALAAEVLRAAESTGLGIEIPV